MMKTLRVILIGLFALALEAAAAIRVTVSVDPVRVPWGVTYGWNTQ